MITIDGVRYSVSIRTPNFATGHMSILGFTDLDTADIVIRSGMSTDRSESTLFHEMLHPMLLQEDGILEEAHEHVIGRLAEKLYTTLRVNNMLRDGWFVNLIDDVDTEVSTEKRVIVDYGPDGKHPADEPVRGDSNEGKVFARW